mmetsp:Transcript_14587/g.34941  ORF Transcript_14587/g.34941 Transcript_14587/m.34941 type:complete len:230 (+) Transcript_14587:4436-5125(+)
MTRNRNLPATGGRRRPWPGSAWSGGAGRTTSSCFCSSWRALLPPHRHRRHSRGRACCCRRRPRPRRPRRRWCRCCWPRRCRGTFRGEAVPTPPRRRWQWRRPGRRECWCRRPTGPGGGRPPWRGRSWSCAPPAVLRWYWRQRRGRDSNPRRPRRRRRPSPRPGRNPRGTGWHWERRQERHLLSPGRRRHCLRKKEQKGPAHPKGGSVTPRLVPGWHLHPRRRRPPWDRR